MQTFYAVVPDEDISSGPAAGSGADSAEGADSASRRAERASTNNSTSFCAPLSPESLSGLYCATSSPSRFLCFTNSMKDSRTSSNRNPPLPGLDVAQYNPDKDSG